MIFDGPKAIAFQFDLKLLINNTDESVMRMCL